MGPRAATTTVENITLEDVVTFLSSTATEDDLDAIIGVMNARRKVLHSIAAASVRVGMVGTLRGLSPKYLNGLTGTVTSVKGRAGTVTLDEQSTNRLRASRTRFFIPDGAKKYNLMGVPLACIKVD